MASQPTRMAISLLAGVLIGSVASYFASHRNARSLQAMALNRAPVGVLVAASKTSPNFTVKLDLAHSFGVNPGDPLRNYSGNVYGPSIGSVSFSYPTLNMPGMGDVIFVRYVSTDGAIRNFILANGAFGVVLESNEVSIAYRQK